MSDFKEYDERRRNFKLEDDIEIHGCVYGPMPPDLMREIHAVETREEKKEGVLTKICKLFAQKKRKR